MQYKGEPERGIEKIPDARLAAISLQPLNDAPMAILPYCIPLVPRACSLCSPKPSNCGATGLSAGGASASVYWACLGVPRYGTRKERGAQGGSTTRGDTHVRKQQKLMTGLCMMCRRHQIDHAQGAAGLKGFYFRTL